MHDLLMALHGIGKFAIHFATKKNSTTIAASLAANFMGTLPHLLP
jgi:hypothetical protein